MQIEVDIATRTVAQDERFYMVRPGERFSLHDAFVRRSSVFLDFPSLELPGNRPFPELREMRAMVSRAIAVRDWHNDGRVSARPSMEIGHYYRSSKGRRLGRYIAALKRLHYEMPMGTILVVPGDGYLSDVLVGELAGPTRNIRISPYKGEDIPARKVTWLGKKQKASLSEELIDLLHNQNPIVEVPKSLREEILKIGFDQYVLGEKFTSRLETTSDDFDILSDYDIQTFLNLISGALAAEDQGVQAKNSIGLQEALDNLRNDRAAIPELTSNINSPGLLRLLSSKDTPLVVAAFLSIALANGDASAATINVVNSKGPPNDPCPLLVQERVRSVARLMEVNALHRACEQVRSAHAKTGLKTSMPTSLKEDRE